MLRVLALFCALLVAAEAYSLGNSKLSVSVQDALLRNKYLLSPMEAVRGIRILHCLLSPR
jgi:hypothetical protein